MDSNRRDRITGAEKIDHITDSTGGSTDVMFVSVSVVHMSCGAVQKDNGK